MSVIGAPYNVEDSNAFLFSIRRRHTISTRDWSSDVCSSDLGSPLGHRQSHVRIRGRRIELTGALVRLDRIPIILEPGLNQPFELIGPGGVWKSLDGNLRYLDRKRVV